MPLAWFLLFDPAERLLSGPRLRYVTGLDRARRRAGEALAVLQRTLPQAPTTPMLEDLVGWLGSFHRVSRVELETVIDGGSLRDESVAGQHERCDAARDP